MHLVYIRVRIRHFKQVYVTLTNVTRNVAGLFSRKAAVAACPRLYPQAVCPHRAVPTVKVCVHARRGRSIWLLWHDVALA